jgi:hypothetical protein
LGVTPLERALAPSAPSRSTGGTATPVSLEGTTGRVGSCFSSAHSFEDITVIYQEVKNVIP